MDGGGSSPLARGLLYHFRLDSDGGGIIPARAGFTCTGSPSATGRRDHPRSRGVYFVPEIRTVSPAGSSPLARGLQLPDGIVAALNRIIPARAGFTPPEPGAGAHVQDHPRSRGVYRTHPAGRVGSVGSSPLARGLHTRGCCRCSRTRIIPARAGFTAKERARKDYAADHPRSRGVYFLPVVAKFAIWGSSPLARGLLNDRLDQLDAGRIIPARAGFTPWRCGASPRSWDHPRSRGVYVAIPDTPSG